MGNITYLVVLLSQLLNFKPFFLIFFSADPREKNLMGRIPNEEVVNCQRRNLHAANNTDKLPFNHAQPDLSQSVCRERVWGSFHLLQHEGLEAHPVAFHGKLIWSQTHHGSLASSPCGDIMEVKDPFQKQLLFDRCHLQHVVPIAICMP